MMHVAITEANINKYGHFEDLKNKADEARGKPSSKVKKAQACQLSKSTLSMHLN